MNCSVNVIKQLKNASSMIFKNKVNEEILVVICDNLAEIYKDGINIDYGIEIISDAIFDKSYKESLNVVLKYIKEGRTLSESFKEADELYPQFFIGMLAVGEGSGSLYKILIALKIFYEKSVFIKKEIKKAVSYPKLVLISFFIFIMIFFGFVIPNFYNIYESIGVSPSENYLTMHKISMIIYDNNIKFYLYFAIYVVIIPIILLKYLINKIKMDKFMKISIIKKYFEYRILFILYIITNSKMNISYGLTICENSCESDYIKNKLRQMNKSIKNGSTLYDASRSINIFSKYTLAIIKIREESGGLEEALKDLCNKLQENIMKNINRCLSLIQPVIIAILSVIITLFLVLFVLPIFEGVQSILL